MQYFFVMNLSGEIFYFWGSLQIMLRNRDCADKLFLGMLRFMLELESYFCRGLYIFSLSHLK
jgi:hypothetical protein